MNFPDRKAFCDTSFFFASLAPEDANYERAGELLLFCTENALTLCTTWDVISETVTLLRYRANYKLAVQFLDTIKPSLLIVRYDDSVRQTAEKVFRKLTRDRRLSYCDAVSYVVVTGILGSVSSLSFDKDFRSLGLTVYPAL
jgi:predicted nucleic acid-binding protein